MKMIRIFTATVIMSVFVLSSTLTAFAATPASKSASASSGTKTLAVTGFEFNGYPGVAALYSAMDSLVTRGR